MDKYKIFLDIARHLNQKLDITPVLYGSLGLGMILKEDLASEDIDILVPQKYISTKWQALINTFKEIGYEMIDEREHEFVRGAIKVGVSYEEDLLSFADVDYKKLQVVSVDGVEFKILTVHEYKKVYEASKKDSYRSNKNNKKDLKKIELINKHAETY